MQPNSSVNTPHRSIGIDLGTTFCAVAYIDDYGRPTTVVNGIGELLTPSAIFVDDSGIIIGKEAVRSSVISQGLFAECFKRDMGDERFRHTVNNVDVPPEVLSALLLQHLKQDAERKLGPVTSAVITVPAYFDENRRIATQQAAQLAGLKVLDIINEPTAAAVAYVYQSGAFSGKDADGFPKHVLVYDLGGGTFDATILEVNREQFRTIATDGDVRLGGKDFDEILMKYVAQAFLERHGVDPRSNPEDAAQLWIDVQTLKHTLSARTVGSIIVCHAGVRMKIEVTREKFEELIGYLIERSISTTSLLLEEAKLTWEKIDRILLVGGSSRIPIITQSLKQISGKTPDQSLSLDEAVAHGAALYGKMIQEKGQDTVFGRCELVNVNSHSLGTLGIDRSTKKRQNAILIPKNTRLPATVSRVFVTAKANQRNVTVTVLEGESLVPEECVVIGNCTVRNLPPGLPAGSPIRVEYSYRSNGCISVTSTVPATRQTTTLEIERKKSRFSESLDVWKARLTGLPEFTGETPHERLDALLQHLGNAAITATVPPSLLGLQQAAAIAKQQLSLSENTLKSVEQETASAGQLGMLQRQIRVAQAESEVKERKSTVSYSLTALAREIIRVNVKIPGTFVLIENIRKESETLGN